MQGPLDWETRRVMVEGLVSEIAIETKGKGQTKTAAVIVVSNFAEPGHAADNGTG